MDFQKMSKPWNIAYLRVLQAHNQCSKFQKFGLNEKNVIENQKYKQAVGPRFFYWFLTYHANFYVSQLLKKLSVCAEIFRMILSYVYISSGKVSSKSEMGHVQP